ncbi:MULTISPECIES: hypothetical protein [Alphaproteobacteria]|uniref:Uncharacterized protein n=2 Tax=Alphaproteobacteria TaxID=28211 RepID=A0A9W7NIF4_9PROT|nr:MULTISPECIES: hypothetical protein [Rhodospirillales]KAA0679559.1 hypothetical protein DS843_16625 [Roseomonas genomospecies 6]KAA0686217.1 hypothetical protein DS837_11005 [Azospirillum brasilense]
MRTQIIDLLTQLGAALPPGFAFNKAGTAYEALVALSVAYQFKSPYYRTTVEVCDHTGTPASHFVIRQSPGKIHPATANAPRPGFIRLTFHGRRVKRVYEIHNSVQFEGRSGSNHEQDVSVVAQKTGDDLRNLPGGGRPSGKDLKVAVECKDIPKGAGVGIARGSVGNAFDLSPKRSRGGSYKQAFSKTRMFAVAVLGGMSVGGTRVLDYYGISVYANANPTTPGPHPLIVDVAARIHEDMKR